jgi:hypothetical protein
MASKATLDRQKSARYVGAAATTHADQVGAALGAVLTPYLRRGEKLPDIALFTRLVGRSVEGANAGLVEADAAHERELSDDAAPREARDEAAAAIREAAVDLRAAVAAAYGPAGLRALGMDGAVPEDPEALGRLAADVATRLEDASVKLGKPRRGLTVDRAAFAEDLRAALPALGKALADVARESREAEQTLTRRRAALAANDLAFACGADLLAALLWAAGQGELGDRVRPSKRKPGRVAEDEPAEPSPPVDGPKDG